MCLTKHTELSYKKKINEVLIYIQSHLDSTLTLDVLSSVANVSKFHFHRIFNAATGEGVLQYIKRIRLENAAFQLQYTTDPITDIAYDSGYHSVSAFSKSFMKHFNISPRAYRKTNTRLVKDKTLEDSSTPLINSKPIHYEIKDVVEHTVIFVRKTGEYTQAAKSAWEHLSKFVEKNGLSFGNSKHIGITYDSPKITAEKHIRYDACISYDPGKITIKKNGDIGIQRIDGGKFAIFKHVGDYRKIGETYHYIYSNWLFSTDQKLANYPSYSIYKQDQSKWEQECSNWEQERLSWVQENSNWEQEVDIYIPIR